MNNYDVIIIGGGLSGLAAGNRLAYYGKRTLILEGHVLPGGLNSYYYRHGTVVDVGLHAMTNFAPEDDRSAPLNKLFRQLRIKRGTWQLCPQTYSKIAFPKAEMRLQGRLPGFREEIGRVFPGELEGFDALCRFMSHRDFMSLEVKDESARAVLRRFLGESLLVDMLLCPLMYYGNPQCHDMEFNQFCIMFQSLVSEGMCRPLNGMKSVIDMLVARFGEYGGELKLGCKVSRIISEGGHATAVECADGAIYQAPVIISSIGAAETAALCDDGQDALVRCGTGQMGFLETIFNLSAKPSEFGMDASIIFRNVKDSFTFACPEGPADFDSQVICAPGNYIGCEDLPAARTIRFTVLASPSWWLEASQEAYASQKEAVAKRLLEIMEVVAPGLGGKVLSYETFTPRTIRRFTGHVNGAIYGAPFKNRQGTTAYPNLFLCGTDQGYLGIVGSMLSGTIIANGVIQS